MNVAHFFSLLVTIVLFCGSSHCYAKEISERSNVLFIVSDDLNTLLGCYGDLLARTPNIDRLAARGVRFEKAYCTFPLCGPSRNSFLTGLYPNSSGIFANAQIFRQAIPHQVSMPQAFRQAGYFVTRIGKLFHYHVPKSVGTDGHDDPASWEVEMNPAGVDRLEEESDIFSLRPGQFGGTLSWYASPRQDAEHTDGLLAADAQWVLERCGRDRSRPFFLAVGFFRPHTPYVAPKDPYFGWYPESAMPIVPNIKQDQEDLPAAALGSYKKEQDKLTDALRREALQAYYASISFMDAQVGKVLDTLREEGLEENTIVIFTSDHGFHLCEHDFWMKVGLMDESSRVPLIIAVPGKKPAVCDSFTELVDLYPTVAELCGLEVPARLQGKSLVATLDDPSVAVRDAAFCVNGNSFMLRTDQWSFIQHGKQGQLGMQLFDMKKDPKQYTNLALDPKHADVVASFQKRLAAKLTEINNNDLADVKKKRSNSK